MDQRLEAAAVDRSFIATFRAFTGGVDGALVRTIGSVPVAATMLPLAFFNAAFVTEPLPAGARDLESAVALFRELGVPFTVHLRTDLDPATRTAAEGLGLAWTGTLPGMALQPRPAPDPPAALFITRATDEARLADHRAVAAAGFGMPPEMVERLMPPALLANPDVRAYVGTEDGVPVAASLAVRTDEILGIYNVATVEAARGRGYGTAMTWAAIADAAAGLEVVILQASALGRPIYERMGFRTVVEYEELEGSSGELGREPTP
jgi:predicted GNAT family acetyltransferase